MNTLRTMGRIVVLAAAVLYTAWYGIHSGIGAGVSAWHWIDWVDLIFHEAGHTIFGIFPEIVTVAAGSATQIAIPAFISGYFFLRGDRLGGSLALLWTGINFFNVAVYAADANLMALPLLGGESVTHDWNYLLGATGLLDSVPGVVAALRGAGMMCVVGALVGGLIGIFYDHRNQSVVRNERFFG